MSNPYNDPNQPNPQQPVPPQYQPQQPYPGQQYQPAPQPKKKRRVWPWIVGIVAILALCGIVGAIANSAPQQTAATTPAATTAATTASVSTSAPTKAPASKPLTWKTTQSFSGNGTKKTAVFTVGDTWKIKYTCQGMGSGVDGVLGVTVYGSDGTMQDLAVNATCKDGKTTADETIEHQGGDVYLDVNGTGDWTIQVQEQK